MVFWILGKQMRGAVTIGAGLVAVLAASGPIFGEDYLPLLSTTTGREIGRSYRTDGTPPTKARGDADKRACLLDPHEVPSSVVERIKSLTDREAMEIEVAKAISRCMAKKGWRTVID